MKAKPKHPVVAQIEAEIERTLQDFGYELVQIKFGGPARHPTLAIYIDKPGGVTSDDCQAMSERLSVLLDVLDPIPSSYELLVSSPGIERPLTRDTDFVRFVGRLAAVTYWNAAGRKATIRGRLQGLEEGEVIMEAEGQTLRLPAAEIEQAHLVYEWPNEAE